MRNKILLKGEKQDKNFIVHFLFYQATI